MNRHPDSRWIIRLWLELMANAGRDERFREIAADMWRESRRFSTHLMAAAYEAAGREPPGAAGAPGHRDHRARDRPLATT